LAASVVEKRLVVVFVMVGVVVVIHGRANLIVDDGTNATEELAAMAATRAAEENFIVFVLVLVVIGSSRTNVREVLMCGKEGQKASNVRRLTNFETTKEMKVNG